MAAMIISQASCPTSTFGFEADSLEALANHEMTPRLSADHRRYFN